MEITREKNGELKELIKVAIHKEDYEERVKQALSDYRKKVKMDGFRPGKVPFGLVKKMYGKAVTIDEVNKILSENLMKYIRDEEMDILGEPLPYHESQEQIDFENQENFEFFFEVGISPEIDPEKLSEVTVPYYNISADEELVEKTVESHKDSTGERVEVEQADEEDIVGGHLFELDEDGNPKEEGIENENALISIQLIKDDAIKDQFLGAQKEDIIDFNLRKALPNDTELASLLNKQKEEIEDLTADFRLKIDSIKRFKKGEVNQELFDKIYGEGNVNSEDEYYQKIREELENNFKRESEYKFMSDLREELIHFYNPPLPDDFLQRWLVEKDENLTQDNIEEEYKNMRENLQWEMISSKLARHFEVEVTVEETKDYAKQFLMMQFQQYGMSMASMPDDFLDNYANEMLQKQEERQRMENAKREEKLALALQDQVSLDTREVSYEEYKEMVSPSEKQTEEHTEAGQAEAAGQEPATDESESDETQKSGPDETGQEEDTQNA